MLVYKIFENLWLSTYSLFCKTKCTYKGCNGKTVKILANGPSLKENLCNLIETDTTCALNFFCLDKHFRDIMPSHYVLADQLFFLENKMPVNVSSFYKTINQVDWLITFYVPLKYYSVFRSRVTNANIKIKTFYRCPFLKYIPRRFEYYLYRIGLHAPTAQNVLIPSIFMMLNEGYEKIYLYGADHSWLSQMAVNDKNQVCLVDKHFYDEENPKLEPWFKSEGDNIFKMHELMGIFYTVFLTYHKLARYAKYLGNSNILNVTKYSFIDAFYRL